jgi:hypothetical protein
VCMHVDVGNFVQKIFQPKSLMTYCKLLVLFGTSLV